MHRRDPNDFAFTFAQLDHELIRHHFFTIDMDERAIAYVARRDTGELARAAAARIRQSVGRAQPFRDGMQTPYGGPNPFTYAQHATATCCRKCIAQWHGILPGRELTEDEVEYFATLLLAYISRRTSQSSVGGEA